MTDQPRELTASAIDAMVARYPAHESAIRHMAATVYALHASSPDAPHAPQAAHPAGRISGKLGDYRILREIGRGGMGLIV